ADIELTSGSVHIQQETNYPWEGVVTLNITPAKPGQRFALKVRIPGWARGEAFPSDLYAYVDGDEDKSEKPTIRLNGKSTDAPTGSDGYATIAAREWNEGDRITLALPMPVRRVVANEKVEADRGRVALMRGPIIYCIEWPEVAGGKVSRLILPDDKQLTSQF